MTENERIADYNGQEDEKKVERRNTNHVPEQRTIFKTKDKVDESHLPTPPPDPWVNPWSLQRTRSQAEMTQIRTLEEDEEIIAYLTNLGVPPSETQTSECPSRNSTTSTIGNLCSEEAFEHLSRLYALTEQILELRDRNAKFFKRVRNLEKLKVLRKADRRLENSFATDQYPTTDISDADTEFAESLLNAMLSNCRDPPFQRRNIRSPASRQARSKFNVEKQMSTDESSKNAPKVSKWTRVKAAFKWERACTNDIAETMDATTATIAGPLPSSTKYLRIPDVETGNSSCTSDSPGINEISDSALPFPPTSSASSSNEGSFDCFQNNVSNHLECASLKTKEGKREPSTRRRSQSLDGDIITLDSQRANDTVSMSEVGQGRPLIRITSEKNHSMRFSNEMDGKAKEEVSRRPALSLTITIPSHEEEIRCMYSPESNSPLPSSTHTSGGNSPQPRKIHRELSTSGDFKRQQSLGEESLSLTSETQGQDSKWNKVRRAFLTNATRSVPPSPIRAVSRQMFLQDAYSCSMENLEKITALNGQVDTRQDYRVLRRKLGAEFHSKLVEWERLKNLSPCAAAKNMREAPFTLLNTREKLLSEERLAPEFRKKLQEWKRVKKERRGSAPFEQQRVNRRRLTDWQVWRSPSKSEYKSQETIGVPGSCGSGESIHRDGKSRLFEDFVRKMETWKKVNDSSNRDTKYFIRSNSNRLGIVSGIDESEFLALEKVLSFFDNTFDKERRQSDARELDECFDGDTRSYGDGAQNVNSNEVLIRTSVGSYRFEGISREFTRKLYDWEKHRGISPRSSTFRLLGSAYEPFIRETNSGVPRSTTTDMESEEQVLFKSSSLKISKSVDDLVVGAIQSTCFIRRSISLPSLDHLTNKLKTAERGNMVPTSIDCQRGEDAAEDVIMDDSEPEAMIVDIEDVIEETASPLERVQPHQTPVYSVAASETISIAVPLGTVTSTHEPSPVLLVGIVDSLNRKQWESKRWNKRQSFSSEDSLNAGHSEMSRIWNNEKSSVRQNDIGSECSSVTRSLNKKKRCVDKSSDYSDQDIDKDSVKSDSSIYSMEMNKELKIEKEFRKVASQNRDNIERKEIPTITTAGENVTNTTGRRYRLDGTNEKKTMHSGNLGNRPAFAISIKDSMDLPSEQKHEQEYHGQRGEGDGSSDDEKDVTEVGTKYDSEYEEITLGATIDPYCCSFADAPLVTNYNKCSANALPESSTNCKLGESNRRIVDMNSYHANRINDGFKGHVKDYDAIKDEIFNLNTCFELPNIKMDLQHYKCLDREKRNSSVAETTMFKNSTEKYRKFENISMSPTLRARNPCNREHHSEPTIRTTSLTVAPCREERCVERILINEETLNKIVVPTASNNCAGNMKTLKPTVDQSTDKDLTKQHDYRPNINRETSINQESGVQKQYSPTRNVLIKTKRIIFSPFRHVEDHSIAKKENKASEDSHRFTTKNKSKSRSASPKINRQDALLRMSFSLPWPLRSSSKDRDLKETATMSDNKEDRMVEVVVQQDFERNKCAENKRKSSIDESRVFEESQVERNMRSLTDISSSVRPAQENSRIKCFVEQKEDRRDVSVLVTPIEQQHNRTCVTDSSSTLKREEKTNETTSSSTFDAYSSDLMHKLEILSSVVAKRDGRPNTLSEELSLESHSLRIRRAKEDFLSGRGGPLCHSMVEPRSSNELCFPDTSVDHCKQILQNEQNAKEEISDVHNCEPKGEAIKEEGVKMLVREDGVMDNELLRSSVVSLPDRVKSASAGMMSVDPNTFKRLEDSSRGCESLPRNISKQQEASGPLAKIVSKLKFTRLMRGKDVEEGSMSTVSRLCRQSLLIDVRDDYENQWHANDRDEARQLNNIDEASREE
ncbi:uncharacterized protein LOC143373916 isoform X2 [Andrena cerasifolii]|uniref:uncharacterized protein LOC143373916 isoform X2 n=1 Tax=Andrena cerasifolii TaxID=2819439 RepID=UPI0040380200